MSSARASGTSVERRLERLVRAGIRINAERALDRVLQEVADSAREVIGCKYAALGVLDATHAVLSDFVASGLPEDAFHKIGPLPTGKGVLGVLIADPRPLRLSDITSHPKAHGIPEHHPPMRSFLGVPIVGRDGPIGNLYCTEKEGADEFSDEDEAIAVMLAAEAAVAVENARLYEESVTLLSKLQNLQVERDRFYAMVNHELRNALTAVHGWAELFLRKEGDDAPRACREVFESAQYSLGLLNDLLDLSKLDAGRLAPQREETDARKLAIEAVKSVEPSARASGIHLTITGDASVPCHTDPQRVRQILINLLTNAVRHSPEEGTVTVEVGSENGQVHWAVVDRGEGIAPEEQQVIFDAYQRASSSRGGGTGLGLTLSRRLAILLGGELSVQSQVDRGSRFTLAIPCYPDEALTNPS